MNLFNFKIDFDYTGYGLVVPQMTVCPQQAPYTTLPAYYFLSNTEVKESGYLKALEFYAYQSGTLSIEVYNFIITRCIRNYRL